MNPVFEFTAGESPLLVSVPHDGAHLIEDCGWSDAAIDHPDRDWHVARLYDFVGDLGASRIAARYSRYVIDLNRPPDDTALYPGKPSSGLVPHETFDGRPLCEAAGRPSVSDVADRLEKYWRPYHERIEEQLAAIRERYGYALLWDAHSIRSEVPSLFPGRLPVLNIGTYDGASCAAALAAAVTTAANASDYSTVTDGRFKGGYITRAYGNPAENRHALQLEISQRAYMNESTREYDEAKADRLRSTLKSMLQAYLHTAEKLRG